MRTRGQKGLGRSLAGRYHLRKEQLLELEGFVQLSATDAIDPIEAAPQRVPFSRVLLGLNVPGIGWVLAQNLARHFETIERLTAATPEEIAEVEGFGPDRAEAVAEWFDDEDNRALVEEIRAVGLRLDAAQDERPKEGPLTGSTYVITGTLERVSREDATARLEALGAT